MESVPIGLEHFLATGWEIEPKACGMHRCSDDVDSAYVGDHQGTFRQDFSGDIFLVMGQKLGVQHVQVGFVNKRPIWHHPNPLLGQDLEFRAELKFDPVGFFGESLSNHSF